MPEYTLPGGRKYRPRYAEPPLIVIHDLVDEETGKTYRELNEEKVHAIPIGTLVELDCDYHEGVRMFVALHTRDCDGTPLYWLSPSSDDLVQEDQRFGNSKWIGGFSGDSLRVVRETRTEGPTDGQAHND